MIAESTFSLQDVLANRAGGNVGHQRRDRISLLKRHPRTRQFPGHLLDLAKPHTHSRPAQFDGESDLAHFHAAAHVVGLHLFGTATFHAGRFVRHSRVGKRAAHDSRPRQILGRERGRRTDIGLGVETDAHHAKYLADGPHDVGFRCSWLNPL